MAEKLLSKIGMIILLILIVLGFTVPSFIDSGDNNIVNTEQRLCQTDSDCYLLCNDTPIEVLCTNNLCQQNDCKEQAYYPYENTLTFNLNIQVENEEMDLLNRSNSRDLFIKFNGENGNIVRVFSSGLSLNQVLEKLNLAIDSECLITENEQYCTLAEKKLVVNLNEEQIYNYDNYVPKEGDKLEIIYLNKN